jgi:hypothetical protein
MGLKISSLFQIYKWNQPIGFQPNLLCVLLGIILNYSATVNIEEPNVQLGSVFCTPRFLCRLMHSCKWIETIAC